MKSTKVHSEEKPQDLNVLRTFICFINTCNETDADAFSNIYTC
jgi:hypothetical protein